MESIIAGFAGELRGGKLQNSIFILADVWRTVSEGVKQKPKVGFLVLVSSDFIVEDLRLPCCEALEGSGWLAH